MKDGNEIFKDMQKVKDRDETNRGDETRRGCKKVKDISETKRGNKGVKDAIIQKWIMRE